MAEAMTNLSDLAARVEAAEAREQRALLLDTVFEIAAGEWPTSKAARFCTLIDAEAYESAALMMVPEGWGWSIHTSDFPGAFIAEVELEGREHGARATTPALALACAALRAKEANNHVKSSSMP